MEIIYWNIKTIIQDLKHLNQTGKSGQIQVFFAHKRFYVMTSHIVPVHSIVVELIQHSQTIFLSSWFTRKWIQYIFSIYFCGNSPPCCASRLSGWGLLMPPVSDQSFWSLWTVGANFSRVAVQNHPLTSTGTKSGLSHPLKSHFRPEVQMYFTCLIKVSIVIYTHLVINYITIKQLTSAVIMII